MTTESSGDTPTTTDTPAVPLGNPAEGIHASTAQEFVDPNAVDTGIHGAVAQDFAAVVGQQPAPTEAPASADSPPTEPPTEPAAAPPEEPAPEPPPA